jgi:hypothetical protein
MCCMFRFIPLQAQLALMEVHLEGGWSWNQTAAPSQPCATKFIYCFACLQAQLALMEVHWPEGLMEADSSSSSSGHMRTASKASRRSKRECCLCRC